MPTMRFEEMIDSWRHHKDRSTARHLHTKATVEHEYQGKQWGHPSTYAFVRFDCVPALRLSFEMRTQWPPNLTSDYTSLLEKAICAAIVDVLVAADEPHVGCAIACTEVKWNDVTSSERSLYRATRAAMTSLREQQEWRFITRHA